MGGEILPLLVDPAYTARELYRLLPRVGFCPLYRIPGKVDITQHSSGETNEVMIRS